MIKSTLKQSDDNLKCTYCGDTFHVYFNSECTTCEYLPIPHHLKGTFLHKLHVHVYHYCASWDDAILTLCLPSSTIGTATHLPNSTFGTDNGAMQNELNQIVLHLCTQWHCLELSRTFSESPFSVAQVNFLPFHCY